MASKFNLERALAGEPVRFKEGQSVAFIHQWDFFDDEYDIQVISRDDEMSFHNREGKIYNKDNDPKLSQYDLVMDDALITRYAVMYLMDGEPKIMSRLFETKEGAEQRLVAISEATGIPQDWHVALVQWLE